MKEWAKLARVGGSTSAVGSSLLGSFLSQGQLFEHIAISITSFCLFCGGMIMNDLLDVEKDKQMRPGRPLASGAISIKHAKFALIALIFISLFCGFAANLPLDKLIAIPITWLTIYGYNGPLKKIDLLAGLSLASARSCNYLIGLGFTAGLLDPILFIPAAVIFLHTIGILIFSKGEDLEGPISRSAWVIQLFIFLILLNWHPVSGVLWLAAVFCIMFKHKAHDKMIRIKGVGWMVNAFCLLDACVLATTEHHLYAPIWIALLFIGRFISRRYPAG